MEKEKKMRYGLKKTKYTWMLKTDETERRGEIIEDNVKSGTGQKTEPYLYLGITTNKEGNLEEHVVCDGMAKWVSWTQ